MGKKLSLEERKCRFVEKANSVHNGKYDYSKFDFGSLDEKGRGIIICPNHGPWLQSQTNHVDNGSGCPQCQRIGKDEFIMRAKEIHGDKFDYSNINYVNMQTHIELPCTIHGPFNITPTAHIGDRKQGCPKCGLIAGGAKRRITTEEFIRRANIMHNNFYDYSETEFTGTLRPVKIICPLHGRFVQQGGNHLYGCGCPSCKWETVSKAHITVTQETFIQRSTIIHKGKYDYSKVKYKDLFTPVELICPQHKEFWQKPHNHLRGAGCRKCLHAGVSKMESEWLTLMGVPEKDRHIRLIVGGKVIFADGYIADTNTIYEFYGDYYHGNPERFDEDEYCGLRGQTYGDLYKDTMKREKLIKKAGYNLIVMWEADFRMLKAEYESAQKQEKQEKQEKKV